MKIVLARIFICTSSLRERPAYEQKGAAESHEGAVLRMGAG